MVARSREYLQRRAISPTRTTTRKQQAYIKRQVKYQTTQQIQKTVPKLEAEKVDYDRAWKEAKGHWSKGKTGAYLYHMSAGDSDPQVRAVYAYVKELDKQTRAGSISPGRTKGSLLASGQIKIQQTPEIDFSKIETGKITYAPSFNTYYTRDQQGKLIVTSGIRGFDYLTEVIRTDGKFKGMASIRQLPDRKIPGFVTVPSKIELAASRVKIVPSNIPNKVIVTLPNKVIGTINAKGRVVIGRKLGGGNKYTFQNGVLVSINGKSTFAREEFAIPEPSVMAIAQPTGRVARLIKELNDLRKIKSTSSIRNKQGKLKNELSLLGVTVATTVIGGVIAIIALPSALWRLAKNPSQLRAIPSAIKSGAISFGQTMRISPTVALGMISGEIFLLAGVGKAAKIVGRVSPQVTTRLSPYFKKIDKGRINIKTTKGETTLEIGVIGKGVPLRKQVQLSGKELEVAATVQADSIISFFGRQKTIRKPIPGEEALSFRTKSLLKKFDAGKINRKEFFELNKRLIRETGDKTLLERSLFLDPKGTVRFTRLGAEQKEAGIMDILSGDFTFKTPKPQILVFSDVSVAKFPASLRDVARKLKQGRTLTEVERIRLVEWQLKKSGKFKPIGDVRYRDGVELEVTIAPGELIKRVKKLGVVLINGKKVNIIEVRLLKPNPVLNRRISMEKRGLLNKKQTRALEKELERVTGFKSSRVRRTPVSRKRARVPVRGLRIGSKAARGRLDRIKKAIKRPPRKVTKRPPRGVPRPPRGVTRRPPRSPPARPPRGVTRRPPRGVPRPPIIPIRLPKQFTKKTLQKAQPVFYVKVKRGGRIVNLSPRPLIAKDAKDFLAFHIDKNLVRTAYFEPLGMAKSVIRIPPKMRGYFARNKHKLRPYRIRVGVKKQLRNGFIEKRRFALDQKSERAQINLARIKSKRRVSRRKPKKRIISRKKIPTLGRLKSTKKGLLLKRKRMINSLKKKR